jgi:antitoxin component of MazEF toxin-antitoxin module
MVKTLTSVGNSKAVILPADMIKKYRLDKVFIEETEDGILIRSASKQSAFAKSIEKLRRTKATLYKRMESQANDPETIRYYLNDFNNLSEADIDIVQE